MGVIVSLHLSADPAGGAIGSILRLTYLGGQRATVAPQPREHLRECVGAVLDFQPSDVTDPQESRRSVPCTTAAANLQD
ncbi:hypothetical protein ANO11243_067430 [Dothideomycetidae sp. 11243]|nr:hypothetical protein ANO11243_067430 [fungal sp. No.11243]